MINAESSVLNRTYSYKGNAEDFLRCNMCYPKALSICSYELETYLNNQNLDLEYIQTTITDLKNISLNTGFV